MRGTAAAALIGAGLLLAGCGTGSITGKADAEGAAAGEPAFSPCDDIPDSALIELGLDPATERRDIMGVKQPGWKICKWRGDGPFVSVLATTHTLDEVRANQKNIEFQDVSIDGRDAFQYRETTDVDRTSCDVAVGSDGGAVLVSISDLGGAAPIEDPCGLAVQATTTLAPFIPA
ncbi:DUF3558 domain-containing protein [Prescottella subtropica]|uniref:DUF3558 domain-containing protein n=1 Tax=Prescottella subtropica TaxID=2545757 RepID=UPI0010F4A900|nr:DUF3558 domain-containing protein [Prescottella subtropica]